MPGRLYVASSGRESGCFATTVRARDPKTDRFILLKVARGTSEDEVSALSREYQLQRRAWALDKRFPQPYSFTRSLRATGKNGSSVRGRAAIFMECVSGPTLRNLIDGKCYLDEPVARRFTHDLLEQELALEELGYCHHDLTPSNIIVDVGGGHCCARLIDLGMACSLTVDDGIRLRGPFQRPDEAIRLRGTPPSPLSDLYGTALVIQRACWGDLLAANRKIPRTPLSRWVARVLRDDFPFTRAALEALPS